MDKLTLLENRFFSFFFLFSVDPVDFGGGILNPSGVGNLLVWWNWRTEVTSLFH